MSKVALKSGSHYYYDTQKLVPVFAHPSQKEKNIVLHAVVIKKQSFDV